MHVNTSKYTHINVRLVPLVFPVVDIFHFGLLFIMFSEDGPTHAAGVHFRMSTFSFYFVAQQSSLRLLISSTTFAFISLLHQNSIL